MSPLMTLIEFGKFLMFMWKDPVMMVKIMYRKKKMEVNRSKDMSRSVCALKGYEP